MTDANRPPGALSSELVLLRPVGVREMAAILRGAPDPELPWEEGFPASPLLDFLGKAASDPSYLGPFYAYLIVRASDGLAVGDAGFHGPPRPDGELEVGYALVPKARGAGLATEAVRLLLGWAWRQPEVRRIVARVDEGNGDSERLLRRLGFKFAGAQNGMRRFALDPRPAMSPSE
jgi:RimJ/RimL family protein N-acetyltransferase